MERKQISFDGGINQQVGEMVPTNTDELNYHLTDLGTIEKIPGYESYDSNLSQLIDTTFASIIKVFVYLAPNKIDTDILTMSNNRVIIVYGELAGASGEYSIKGYAQDTDLNWNELTFDGLNTDGIIYTDKSNPRLFATSDKLVITDGVNIAHFIRITAENKLESGKLGIDSPGNKPERNYPDDSYREEYFKISDVGTPNDVIAEPGLAQYCFTVETEIGNESNPSPISETTVLQFFAYDDNGNNLRYIKEITIKNLDISDINSTARDRIKYLNIYRRLFKYANSWESNNFRKVGSLTIASENDNYSYTDTTSETSTGLISLEYNNFLAPIAKDCCAVKDSVFLFNLSFGDRRFPYNFANNYKVIITNSNSITAVDGVVRIRLFDSDSTADSALENLLWSDYDTDNDGIIDITGGLDKFRFYDQDQTTPLETVYIVKANQNYCDVWVKIPLLTSNSTKIIYFCYGGEGITDGNENGQWYNYNAVYNQKTFNPLRVNSADVLVASPALENSWQNTPLAEGDILLNYANTNRNGRGDFIVSEQFRYRLPLTTDVNGTPVYIMAPALSSVHSNGNSKEIDFNFQDENSNNYPIPTQGYMSLVARINNSDSYLTTDDFISVAGLKDPSGNGFVISVKTGNMDTNTPAKWHAGFMSAGDEDYNAHTFSTMPLPLENTGYSEFFVLLSWDFITFEISLYVVDLTNIADISKESATLTDGTGFSSFVFKEFFVGMIVMSGYPVTPTYSDAFYNNIQLVQNVYLDADNDNNTQLVYNIARNFPPFSTPVGTILDGSNEDEINLNINFEKYENENAENYPNMAMFSKPGGFAFPGSYLFKFPYEILRGIPAPSYLPFEYQNIIIVFMQKAIHVIALEGTPEQWSESPIIPEHEELGLYAPDSLVVTPQATFWVAENGIVKWQKGVPTYIDRFQTESGKTYQLIDIPLSPDIIGAYSPMLDQYWLKVPNKYIPNEYYILISYNGYKVNNSPSISFASNGSGAICFLCMAYAPDITEGDIIFNKSIGWRVRVGAISGNFFKLIFEYDQEDGTSVTFTTDDYVMFGMGGIWNFVTINFWTGVNDPYPEMVINGEKLTTTNGLSISGTIIAGAYIESTDPLYIAVADETNANLFFGALDEIAIFNRTLSESEINNILTPTLGIPIPPNIKTLGYITGCRMWLRMSDTTNDLSLIPDSTEYSNDAEGIT
jgi:hypothetical protein